jgi:hypothetical protein
MRQIVCDSRDRTSGTAADFTIQLPEALVIEPGHRGRVDALRIPVCIGTITTANQFLVVICAGVPYPINIAVGNYDGPRLAAAIQTQLTANVTTYAWTVVYDVNNIAMKISASGPFTIDPRFLGAQLLARAYTQTANSYSFSYVPVQGMDVVYLCCPNWSSLDNVGPKQSHDFLLACPFTKNYGSVEVFATPTAVWFDVPPGVYQQLHFQLRDRDSNILDLVSNLTFVLTLD